MSHRTAIAAFCAAVLLASAPSVPLASDRDDLPAGEIRLFKLKHIDTKTAITLFRTLLNTRIVAEVPDLQTVIIRDDPETVAQAADILKQVDIAPPRWIAELVVDSGKRQNVLREIDLAGGRAQFRFGDTAGSAVGVQLDCEPSGADTIGARYEISVLLIDEQAGNLGFTESGEARIEAGGSLSVFRPGTDAQRRDLGRILGVEDQADHVGIRFRQGP